MSKSRLLAAAALVVTGAFGVGMAQAQESQVSWSISVGSPLPVFPVPVFVRPAAVVVQPAPHYGYEHGYGHGYQHPTRWDRDGDGIPNRYDRLYNPAWDRDGDGIPNRYDRFDNRRHDRDGDGIPNRHDRH
jgi:hypothetical protein